MNELIFFGQVVLSLIVTGIIVRRDVKDLLIWIPLQTVLANLLVLKQVVLFGLTVTSSDIFGVTTLLSLNILRELAPREISQKATFYTFLILLFFAAAAMSHLAYFPAPKDSYHAAYAAIFKQSHRILLVSIISFYLCQKIDLWSFTFFKNHTPWSFHRRNFLSSTLSQAFDTAFFSILALPEFYDSLPSIMLWSFFIKMIAITSLSACLHLLRRFPSLLLQ